jgi:preprotein translocase subunit Sec63
VPEQSSRLTVQTTEHMTDTYKCCMESSASLNSQLHDLQELRRQAVANGEAELEMYLTDQIIALNRSIVLNHYQIKAAFEKLQAEYNSSSTLL